MAVMPAMRLKKVLPFAGIPIICVALVIVKGVHADIMELLQFEFLLLFGYIAAVYDIREKRIPNICVLLMLGAWAVITIPFLFYNTATALPSLGSSVGGFVTAGALFLLVYFVSRKGLGGGDVKFMAVAGLYLGFRSVLPAMLYGSILSAIAGGVLLLTKRIGRKDAMPFAPFLYIGILLTIFLL
jgi:Flp pilus assembly protein protease CpaA